MAQDKNLGSRVDASNKRERSRVAKKYKGVGSIGAIEGYTTPSFSDSALAPPAKPGMPTMSIGPEPKAGSGWRKALRNTPANPKDTKRPALSDKVRT